MDVERDVRGSGNRHADDSDSLTALADSGKIDFPPAPRAIGRRLANTAALVAVR